MNTIISKRPTDFVYTSWVEDHGNIIPEFSITIKGGSGVADPTTLITHEGVATIVDDKALDKLMRIGKFKRDIERGLIKVIQHQSVKDQDKIDSIASDKMIDKSEIEDRPLTSEDLVADGAVENDDGSFDVSNGGKNARAVRRDKTAKRNKSKSRK